MTNEMAKIKVLNARVDEAVLAVDKLVKRGKRTGNTDISYVVSAPFSEKVDGKIEVFNNITVSGEAPHVNGFEFFARIEFLPSGGQVIMKAPLYDDDFNELENDALDERFHQTDCRCEHCGKKRGRKDVFIVINRETGEQKQVGRTCLRDFTGIDSPERILWRFGFWNDLSSVGEEYVSAGANSFSVDLADLLAGSEVDFEKRGCYFSRDKAFSDGTDSTVDLVALALYEEVEKPFRSTSEAEARYKERKALQNEYRAAIREYRMNNAEHLDKIVAYFRDMPEDAIKNDYIRNIVNLFKSDTIYSKRHVGTVCSATVAYKREIGAIEAAKKREKEDEAAKHTVIDDGRQEVTGEIISVKNVAGYGYGEMVTKTLVKRTDGAKFWGTLPSSISDAVRGDIVKFVATIEKKEDGFAIFKRPTKAEII